MRHMANLVLNRPDVFPPDTALKAIPDALAGEFANRPPVSGPPPASVTAITATVGEDGSFTIPGVDPGVAYAIYGAVQAQPGVSISAGVVTLEFTPTSGTFTLVVNGVETGRIGPTVTGAALTTLLNAAVPGAAATGAAGGPWTVTGFTTLVLGDNDLLGGAVIHRWLRASKTTYVAPGLPPHPWTTAT
jgi:hypothetical protein